MAALEEVARSVGQPVTLLQDWEAGRSKPTFSQLERLADEYGISLNALLLPHPPPSDDPIPDFRTPSPELREPISRITRRELRRARYLQALLAQVPVLPAFSLPPERDVDRAASIVRQSLGVTVRQQLAWRDAHTALAHWREALNRAGVLVLQCQLPVNELHGLALPREGVGPPVILVNQSDHPNRRIFTLFHELGHLMLQKRGGICDPWRAGPDGVELSRERQCNRFAGAVLLPRDPVQKQREISQIQAATDDQEIIRLLRVLGDRYRVSSQVLWYRLHELGLVTNERFRALWTELYPFQEAWPLRTREERGGMSRPQRARAAYGPMVLHGLLQAVEQGALGAATLMRALNLGAGDLTSLRDQFGG
jgi:Zn-dependent peptidase ImmA (M78 family)